MICTYGGSANYKSIEQILGKKHSTAIGKFGCKGYDTFGPFKLVADEPTGALDSKASRLLLDRFEALNREQQATILMVTHDAFTASYCRRILFIKDGRPFTELIRGADSRKDFFARIIQVVTLLGGDDRDVL